LNAVSRPYQSSPATTDGAVLGLDLVGLAAAIRDGDVTAEHVTRLCLERFARLGRAFNAQVRIDEQSALEAARAADRARQAGEALGVLHGVPLAHKDIFNRAGLPCTSGSKIRAGYVPRRTATVLQRLDLAGGIEVGALHMAEFALSPTGFNGHDGHALNPWNPEHVPGGSSSGSGIAVAARMVFGSLGTDTGGSIRQPAAMCSITGLKPTNRRVSTAGVMPLSRSLDCVGPLAQSARDCARLLRVIGGADPHDGAAAAVPVPDYERQLDLPVRGLRVAVPRGYYNDIVEGEVRTALDESLRVLRNLGMVVVETRVPDMELIAAATHVIMASEGAAIHGRWLVERPEDYSDQVRGRLEAGLYYPATRYLEAQSLRTRLAQQYLDLAMGDCDVIHLPAIPMVVPTIAQTTSGSAADALNVIANVSHCMRAINFLGLPSLAVPAGFSPGGLPIGFQLVGKPFDEAMVLRVGHAFQGQTQWHRQIPPLAA
jgi:aspartyl-tRNA(Asn)/glutamyl-tRNA(Gln) amidotransferase subunit A